MTIGDWLIHAQERLTASGCPDPQVDARWIAEDTLSIAHTAMHFELENAIEPEKLALLEKHLNERVQGVPVQYILKSAYFMGLKFYVDDRVLIPRQDTETLVEAAVIALQGKTHAKVLDLGTGSGAIGLSIKTLRPSAEVTLTDVSMNALEVARRNARELNADVTIRPGDLFKAIAWEKFDMIVSNPPYIPREELPLLQREVLHEPKLALDGGADGLDFYRRIAENAGRHLRPEGSIYLEVGIGESEAVLELLRNHISCAQSGVLNDLNGIPRVVWARSV